MTRLVLAGAVTRRAAFGCRWNRFGRKDLRDFTAEDFRGFSSEDLRGFSGGFR